MTADDLQLHDADLGQIANDMAWFGELYAFFAPVRAEIIGRGIGEEEVNADIDTAVRAVREPRSHSIVADDEDCSG